MLLFFRLNAHSTLEILGKSMNTDKLSAVYHDYLSVKFLSHEMNKIMDDLTSMC